LSALTYELVARYLKVLLPRRVMATHEPQFAAASHALNGLNASAVNRWSKKLVSFRGRNRCCRRSCRRMLPRLAYKALLSNRRFGISYSAIESEQAKRYPTIPLGLVLNGGVLYLVSTARGHPDPCIFALHRMSTPCLFTNRLPSQMASIWIVTLK
jgi:hypothetical protein